MDLTYFIMGATFLSLLGFIVSLVIFAISGRKSKSNSRVKMFTALPHVLLILVFFIFFMMISINEPEKIKFAVIHLLCYAGTLLIPAFLLKPVKRV
jgi:hypothetical protein